MLARVPGHTQRPGVLSCPDLRVGTVNKRIHWRLLTLHAQTLGNQEPAYRKWLLTPNSRLATWTSPGGNAE